VSARHVAVRAGAYRDSIRLMQISRMVSDLPGVSSALVAMATELNVDQAIQMGYAVPPGAGGNDLLIGVTVDEAGALPAVLERLDAELSRAPAPATTADGGQDTAPRTVAAAAKRFGATLALVSTPGRYAFVEAMDALDAGVSVLVFSDNVPLAEEVRLKRVADERGLLVMGPDCGTAIIAGVGLGFANVVRPGPVGVVAASGTGAQQVMSLLSVAGVGISHCLGVGGRDLSAAVAGASALTALRALDDDPATELVLVVGKAPEPAVADRVRSETATMHTPALIVPVGPGQPDLTAGVENALRALDRAVPDPWPRWLPEREFSSAAGALRGLFSGGSLCLEALAIAEPTLGQVRSNIAADPRLRLDPSEPPAGHAMFDLGDDRLTLGRPHPMIDIGPRLARIAAEAADPVCRVILLDVVLGHGAHPDPAAELAPAIADALAVRNDLAVVCSLVGTADDPQDVDRQAGALRSAGAAVFASNAEATRYAVRLVAA
jgi:FdrA protein